MCLLLIYYLKYGLTDHMSLVLLCREKDFKQFGHAKVFSKLQADFKEL